MSAEWFNTTLELVTCGYKASTALDRALSSAPRSIQNSELVELITFIKKGQYGQVLHQTLVGREFLMAFKTALERVDVTSSTFLRDATAVCSDAARILSSSINQTDDRALRLMEFLLCGIASLLAYVQVNSAGLVLPAPTEEESNIATKIFEELLMGSTEWVELDPGKGEVMPIQAKAAHSRIRAKARAALALNGEEVYPCIHFPSLLVFARASLGVLPDQIEYGGNETLTSVLNSGVVILWRLRAASAHHRALMGNTETIRSTFLTLLEKLTKAWCLPEPDKNIHPLKTTTVELTSISDTVADEDREFADKLIATMKNTVDRLEGSAEYKWLRRYLIGCAALELNELAREFWFYGVSEQFLDITAVVGGYAAKLVGVMGRRTKYQAVSHSQLYLAGATQEDMINSPWKEEMTEYPTGTYPKDMPLEDSDDILYHKIKVDDEKALLNAARTAVQLYCERVGGQSKACSSPSTSEASDDETFDGFVLGIFSDLAQAAVLASAQHDRLSKPTFITGTEAIVAQTNAVLDQYHEFQERVERENEGKKAPDAGTEQAAISPATGEPENDTDMGPDNKGLPDLPLPVHDVQVIANEDPKPRHTFKNFPGARPFWGTYFSALTLRSLMEVEEPRRHLRSLLQFEYLIAQYPAPSLERLGTVHSHRKAVDELEKLRIAGADEDHVSFVMCRASQVPTYSEVLFRMEGVFSSSLSNWWILKRTFAEMALLKNLKQTALETYIEIGLWGQAIEMYIALGRGAQAERMIRTRLPNYGYLEEAKSNPTPAELAEGPQREGRKEETTSVGPETKPGEVHVGVEESDITTSLGSEVMEKSVYDRYSVESELAKSSSTAVQQKESKTMAQYFDVPEYRLWSLLGDLLDDPIYYLKSWDVSGKTFGHAQRQLGKYLLRRKKYDLAARAFKTALAINGAQPKVWYACGICHFELFELTPAIECFTRCVALQPDNGEAWNNIAAAHLYLRNRKSALGALEHATRLMYNSWKVWENYLYCALDLNESYKALKALERLTALRGTTDNKSLLTIRYSPRQAKLQMLALGHITSAAVADAEKLLKKFDEDRKNVPTVQLQAGDVIIESPSLFSQRLLSVISQLEESVAAMEASESDLGGRHRGGGVEAGEANSITAQVAVKETQERERRRLRALASIDEKDALSDDEEVEEAEQSEEKKAQQSDDPSDARSTQLPLDKAYGSVATQYHAFLHDCAARVFCANRAWQPAAERRDRQANLIQSLRGWATHPKLVDTILAISQEGTRMYKLAIAHAQNLGDTSLASTLSTAARMSVDRVIAGLRLAERNGEVMTASGLAILKKATDELTTLLSSIPKVSAAGEATSAKEANPAERDTLMDYYGGGGYDDWRQ